MALLGSSVDPRLFVQDFSGFTRAADIQGQSMANLGGQIGQGVKDFAQASQERKKLDAETKATRSGIESAIKLGDALGFDVKGMLSPVLAQMDDPNTTPMQAAALGREAANQISNVLNLGFKAQEFDLKRQELGMSQSAFDAERNAPIAPSKLKVQSIEVEGDRVDVLADDFGNLFDPSSQARITDLPGYAAGKDISEVTEQGNVSIDLPKFSEGEQDIDFGVLPERSFTPTPTADAQLAANTIGGLIDGEPTIGLPIEQAEAVDRGLATGLTPRGRPAVRGPLVTVGGSQPAPSPGYYNVLDENQNLIEQRVIPGGPADVAQQAAEEQAIPEKEARARNMFTTAANILRDVGNAIPLIEETTPFLRNEVDKESIVGRFSPGTKTFDAVQLINSVKSSIAVSELINLRSTGTTLGQVPQRQLEMLSTLLGSLTPGQSNKRLISTIDDIYKNYGEILDQYIKRNPEDEMAEFVTIRREIDQFRKKIKNEKGETKTTVESEFQKRLDAIKARQ